MAKRQFKTPTFTWQPFSEKQLSVIKSVSDRPARINILDGAVRSGKTIASIVAWARYVTTEAPPSVPLLMSGRTERTLYRNVIEPMISMFGERHCRYNKALGELTFYGRLIYAAGASDERAENKIRGMTVGGWYADELTLHPESFFKMGLTRMSVEGARLYGTTNPDGPGHWLKKEYLDRADELDILRWVFRLEDNLALPKSYIEALKKEFTGLFYKRFIDGLWVMAEGSIYDMISPDAHYVKQLPPQLVNAWVGIDYGTTNPFHAVYIVQGMEPHGKEWVPRLYVADELVFDSKVAGHQKTDSEYSEMLRNWLANLPMQPSRIFVDPSASSFIVQLYKDRVQGVTQANNDVLDGIRSVSTLLSNNRLVFVEAKTKRTLNEMQGYVWDTRAAERGEDKPVKVDDHGPDSLRYGVRGTASVWRSWVTADRRIRMTGR